MSILVFQNAKVGRGGVVFKLGLYCFKISSGLGLYYFLKGVRFYSRVGLHLRGYGTLKTKKIEPYRKIGCSKLSKCKDFILWCGCTHAKLSVSQEL